MPSTKFTNKREYFFEINTDNSHINFVLISFVSHLVCDFCIMSSLKNYVVFVSSSISLTRPIADIKEDVTTTLSCQCA